MKISERALPLGLGAILIGGAVLTILQIFGRSSDEIAPDMVVVPALSASAERGKALFDKNCAECHGANGAGTDKGPPLVHDIYNPGHHSDEAFLIAVQRGVRQHHWPFGDMPRQPQVTKTDVSRIVRYIRELQTANGINYRPHRM